MKMGSAKVAVENQSGSEVCGCCGRFLSDADEEEEEEENSRALCSV